MFVQIYRKGSYGCTTISRGTPEVGILLTPEEGYLKQTGLNSDYPDWMVSQLRNIEVIGTYFIQNPTSLNILRHGDDEVLDAEVRNGILIVYGDGGGVVFVDLLDADLPDIPRVPVDLKASSAWMQAHGLPCFGKKRI